MASTSVNLGKVVPSYIGAWSSSATYTKLDIVTYNSTSYIALKDVPVNTAPSNSSTYWGTLAQGITGPKGDTGIQGKQGIQGIQGIQGVTGKDFSISKTFPSVVSMTGTSLKTGDFVMISSTVEDPDNAKLYLWNGTGFTFVTDMSGATGIKGDRGEQGIQGIQGIKGEQGLQGIQGVQGETGSAGKDAVINVVTQAEYDALADKSGVYFIEG